MGRSWAGEIQRTPLRVVMVDPGATRTAMRAQAAPGEDPASLPHPSEVAARIAALAGPGLTETGKLYVVRDERLKDYRLPD